MAKSSIEWTDATWNPVTGCTKISPGCKHCYAERMAKRLKAMGQRNYANGFDLTLQPHMLELPLKWRQPLQVFVNSMSDLFHKDVPTPYVKQVFDVMRRAHWHRYQVLTKRSERLRELAPHLPWEPLRQTGARIKFLSLEPLLGPLPKLNLRGIDWVIVGGESGPGARPMDADWVRQIRDQCLRANVSFFFKQWGGPVKSKTGRMLDGRTWDHTPGRNTSVVEDFPILETAFG